MSEFKIMYIAMGSLMGLLLATFFYVLAGRDGTSKGIRRFGASFVIATTVCLSSFFLGVFSFWFLLSFPIKTLEYVQGYSDNSGFGWLKRLGITLTSCMGGLMFCLVLGGATWWLLPVHFIVGAMTILFSKKNPIFAAAEEPLVCVLNSIVFIFYPFVVV